MNYNKKELHNILSSLIDQQIDYSYLPNINRFLYIKIKIIDSKNFAEIMKKLQDINKNSSLKIFEKCSLFIEMLALNKFFKKTNISEFYYKQYDDNNKKDNNIIVIEANTQQKYIEIQIPHLFVLALKIGSTSLTKQKVVDLIVNLFFEEEYHPDVIDYVVLSPQHFSNNFLFIHENEWYCNTGTKNIFPIDYIKNIRDYEEYTNNIVNLEFLISNLQLTKPFEEFKHRLLSTLNTNKQNNMNNRVSSALKS